MDKPDTKDPRTLFIRGISFDIGDAELTEAFSAVGPVRHAFLVQGGRNKKHKGFGFVQFALEEDAQRAVVELDGTELAGRKIQVETAEKRAPMEERKVKRKEKKEVGAEMDTDRQEEKKPAAKKARPTTDTKTEVDAKPRPKPRKEDTDAKHALVRTVALGGLTATTIDAAIALGKTKGTVEAVVTPVPADVVGKYKFEQDGCFGEVVLLQYSSTKEAMAVIESLHGHKLGSAPKKRQGGSSLRLWARQVSGEGLHLKRWRLVVRNLSFKATEADVRAAFEPAGFIWEVTIPRNAEGTPRGFAFVGFICRSHAERGIKAVNGTKVAGRPVAVDWAVSKREFEAGVKSQAPPEEADDGDALSDDDDPMLSDSDSDSDGGKRRTAHRRGLGQEMNDEEMSDLAPEAERGMLHNVIDDILGGSSDEDDEGGNRDQKRKKAGKGNEPKEDEEDEDSSGSEDDFEEALEEGEHEETDNEEDSSSESGDDGEDAEEEEKDKNKKKGAKDMGDMFGKAAAGAKAGTRQDAVERVERQAKRVAEAMAAKSAADRPAPQGATVFVRGLSLDATREQLFQIMRGFGPVASCRLVINKDTTKSKGTAFVDFRSVAAAEMAVEACVHGRSKKGPGIVIAGRQIDVDLALDSEGARKLAAEKAGGMEGSKDRRNLYLAKEGAIVEGSAAWEDLSAGDRSKRKRAAEETRTKLRSPNFCVARTRLNIRNVPRTWDEKRLKALILSAVKERATKANPKLVQVKILKEEEGGRSKGIAFVELGEHEHALCALRQLNNNPDTWGKDHRPIVEFAIDNVKALKIREARQARSLSNVGGASKGVVVGEEKEEADGGAAAAVKGKAATLGVTGVPSRVAEDDAAEEKAKSRRKQRQERRLMLKQRQRQRQGKEHEHALSGAGAGGDGDGEAHETAAAKKSRRRREQRKRQKDGAENGNVEGHGEPVPAAKKPRVAEAGHGKAVEDKGRERKQRSDALVDMVASAGVGEGVIRKKRSSKTGDRLDKLVDAHKAKFFDGGGGGAKAPMGKEKKTMGGKRWFD